MAPLSAFHAPVYSVIVGLVIGACAGAMALWLFHALCRPLFFLGVSICAAAGAVAGADVRPLVAIGALLGFVEGAAAILLVGVRLIPRDRRDADNLGVLFVLVGGVVVAGLAAAVVGLAAAILAGRAVQRSGGVALAWLGVPLIGELIFGAITAWAARRYPLLPGRPRTGGS